MMLKTKISSTYKNKRKRGSVRRIIRLDNPKIRLIYIEISMLSPKSVLPSFNKASPVVTEIVEAIVV
ncbi:hypothetical protein V9T40_003271 [Parthenolecanium corni]|uniref:Uncharacterized protein n=1 Tax=Parthenolecanium corni TaxID=536013 RepID=A0AAN9YA04_9HEMI